MKKRVKFIPVFFKAVKIALIVEVKSQLFEVLIEILSELLLQTITEFLQKNKKIVV